MHSSQLLDEFDLVALVIRAKNYPISRLDCTNSSKSDILTHQIKSFRYYFLIPLRKSYKQPTLLLIQVILNNSQESQSI